MVQTGSIDVRRRAASALLSSEPVPRSATSIPDVTAMCSSPWWGRLLIHAALGTSRQARTP